MLKTNLIQKLDSCLSSKTTNYILGVFNFTESHLDTCRPSKKTIKNYRSLNEIQEKIRDKYELADSIRFLNPKLCRYSYVKIIQCLELIAYNTSLRPKVERLKTQNSLTLLPTGGGDFYPTPP